MAPGRVVRAQRSNRLGTERWLPKTPSRKRFDHVLVFLALPTCRGYELMPHDGMGQKQDAAMLVE